MENGVINQFSQRWTHFIDPQSQANKWIKNMVRPPANTATTTQPQLASAWLSAFLSPQEKDNGLDVFKLSDRDFLRSMENAIRFGKPCLLENVGEELDPALEPVLLKQVGLCGAGQGCRPEQGAVPTTLVQLRPQHLPVLPMPTTDI